MIESVTGVVLAGGRSSRFGSNKAVAPWAGGTLAGAGVARLAGVFADVLIVGKDPSVAEGLFGRARFVRDEGDRSHPLVGILAALRESAHRRVFVTACDMPLLEPRLVRRLCDASPGYAAAAAVWGGRPQPLCAVYSRDCVGVMRLLLEEERPVREIFEIVPTRFLTGTEVVAEDPEGRTFVDIDTPRDYETAKGLALHV
jgi:molybdopterin-guanine dinucleotide biosynthesis protein A